MTDLSTFAAQHNDWAPRRARLWGNPEPKRMALPAPHVEDTPCALDDIVPPTQGPVDLKPVRRAPHQPPLDRYAEHPEFAPDGAKWRQITREICIKHDVDISMVMGDSRRIDVVAIRHECFFRVYNETMLSKARVGWRFGKDRTSVWHGIRRHIRRAAREGIALVERTMTTRQAMVMEALRLRADGKSNNQIAIAVERTEETIREVFYNGRGWEELKAAGVVLEAAE